MGSVGNCPPSFWQNKRHRRVAVRRQRCATLLFAHPVLGSHLRPWKLFKLLSFKWFQALENCSILWRLRHSLETASKLKPELLRQPQTWTSLYTEVHISKKGRHATLTYVGLFQFFFFYSSRKRIYKTDLWISVGSTLATKGLNNVDKSSVVLDPPLGASGLLLFLLFGLNFGGLTLDLTSTCQRSVNLKLRIINSELMMNIKGSTCWFLICHT